MTEYPFESHDWVENYREFEAVFCCTNEIHTHFDVDETIRCFQTFHWFEVNSQTGDLTFNHSEFGVSLVFDGGVVAINAANYQDAAGSDKLRKACFDLFCALTELGWVNAVVYHPFETSSLFLTDMGKAIPAHAKFNLELAKSIKNTNNLPEAAAMMAHHMSAMPSFATGSTLVDALSSLGGDLGQQVHSPVNKLAAFSLSDDEPMIASISNEPITPPIAGISSRQFMDDTPPIANIQIPNMDSVTPAHSYAEPVVVTPAPVVATATSNADLVLEIERLQESLAIAQRAEFAAKESVSRYAAIEAQNHSLKLTLTELEGKLLEEQNAASSKNVDLTDRVHALVRERDQLLSEVGSFAAKEKEHSHSLSSLTAELVTLRSTALQVASVAVDQETVDGGGVVPLVKVGVSGFCFDVPHSPLTDDDVDAFYVSGEFNSVTHLHPGLVDQAVRWDIFSEVDKTQPWFLETLLNAMGVTDGDAVALGQHILRLLNSQPFLQVRDVQGAEINGPFDQMFEALALCEAGRAFVDVRNDDGKELAENMSSTLVIRGVATSADKVLYVVHVDALDGPFVHWLVDLMAVVAGVYSASKRFTPVVPTVIEPCPAVDEGQAVNEQLAIEIKDAVGPLLLKLKALGVSI